MVINYDDTWDVNGRNRTFSYTLHPGPVLRLKSTKLPYFDYIRWTDYETAEVGVKYTDILGTWERLTLSSREDNVTITKISKSSLGAKINMTLSLDECWSLRGWGAGDEKNMRYKKLVDENATYIAQIAHFRLLLHKTFGNFDFVCFKISFCSIFYVINILKMCDENAKNTARGKIHPKKYYIFNQ